jgi:hypothetical protein
MTVQLDALLMYLFPVGRSELVSADPNREGFLHFWPFTSIKAGP